MLQEPPPDPQPDGDEPAGFSPAGDSGAPWPEDDPQGSEQGLFVCLPAEELSLAGFAQGGQADTMSPGPLLGMVLHTVIGEDGAGLPGLSDDQLIGVLSGGRRMEAWTAWVQLAAMRELARRRPAVEPGDSGRAGGSDPGPSVAALVTITVPAETLQRTSETPGEVGAFGLIDAPDVRDLVAAAARHPRTRWCITVLNPDGTAAAHGCASGRHPPPGRANLTVTSSPGLGPDPPPGTRPQDYLHSLRSLDIRLVSIARGHCDHAHAETGYRPSRKLQHLVRARSARCTAPGCGRPAARCDLDHTVPWDQGGITCECDLAPLCRHHHKCKQAQGWRLEQPQPGVLLWRTPSGRSYVTGPTAYLA